MCLEWLLGLVSGRQKGRSGRQAEEITDGPPRASASHDGSGGRKSSVRCPLCRRSGLLSDISMLRQQTSSLVQSSLVAPIGSITPAVKCTANATGSPTPCAVVGDGICSSCAQGCPLSAGWGGRRTKCCHSMPVTTVKGSFGTKVSAVSTFIIISGEHRAYLPRFCCYVLF